MFEIKEVSSVEATGTFWGTVAGCIGNVTAVIFLGMALAC